MTKKIIIATIFIVIVACGYVFFPENSSMDRKEMQPVITINDFEIKVEIADTLEKRNQGLSGRPFMAENEGMLFVFEEPRRPIFWMKDMLIPLDFIYIKDDQVVDLVENVQPEGSNPVRRISPETNVLYVLEVNAGVVQKYNIEIGDNAILK